MFSVKNISIFVAIVAPFFIIGVILAIIYLPYLWTEKLKTDFIYTSSRTYCLDFKYDVSGEKIVKKPLNNDCNNSNYGEPEIYYFDADKNSSKKLSKDEIDMLKVNTGTRSTDGFEITEYSQSSGGFFGSTSKSGIFAKKDSVQFELSIHPEVSYYNFVFLSWIKEESPNLLIKN